MSDTERRRARKLASVDGGIFGCELSAGLRGREEGRAMSPTPRVREHAGQHNASLAVTSKPAQRACRR